jgi:RNA polymerase sigma factor (sigma-70 family)
MRRAFLLVGSNELANDIVQNAMVEVYRRWATLDTPAAYLTRAVVNGCHPAGRKRASHLRLVDRLAQRREDRSEAEILDDVLASLPYQQRAAIVLRYYAGLSTGEIAEALGCAPGSVGPWISRALKAMRKELQ